MKTITVWEESDVKSGLKYHEIADGKARNFFITERLPSRELLVVKIHSGECQSVDSIPELVTVLNHRQFKPGWAE